MRLFGLIGFPLSHSQSPALFRRIWEEQNVKDCDYQLFPIHDLQDLPQIIAAHPNLVGLNVTIPYKQQVLEFCHILSSGVRDTGAANTLKIERPSGKIQISAHNTDILGFTDSLHGFQAPAPFSALVLGNGGASKAVQFSLRQIGIPFQVVSRRMGEQIIRWEQLDEAIISRHRLIINTTPLGMSPNISECPPIPWEAVGSGHFLYDLIYNPPMTAFLAEGQKRGAQIKNGQEMLELQARAAWQIWNA